MRILCLINKFGIGGAERLALDQIAELRRRGTDVEVATLRSGGDMPHRVHSIPFGSLFDLRAWYTLVKYLQTHRPDVVITHLWFANTIGRIAARLSGVKRMYTFEHNVYDRIKTRKQFVIDRALQRWSTKIIAVSPTVRDSLIAHGISKTRIAVVRNGIDLSRFRRVAVRAPHTPFTFLFIGRLVEQKGIDVLLEAFASVDDARLLIVGDGVLRAELEREAGRTLQNRVAFLGTRSDVPELFLQADAFVFPSRWEGYGIALAEAAASGLPIIASDLPATRDLLVHDKEAILVPAGDAAALSEAMQKLMHNAALQERLSKAALLRSTEFSITTHIDNLLKVIS